jgi:glycosyltransferase involved in cell wall biosynthesis
VSEVAAPVRVACVSVSAALGGSERVLLEFAARAARYGIEPTVVLPKDGPLAEALGTAGVAVAVAPASEGFLALSQRTRGVPDVWELVRGLRDWARAIRAQLPAGTRVLYSNGFKAHLACAGIPGYRRIWHLHEFPPERTGPIWPLLAAALPHRTIAVSEAVAHAWRVPRLLTPTVVLNGVDLELFRPAERTFWVHDALAVPRAARLIGMPAVFAKWKGQLLVVEAFERAASQLPDVHLVIVGGAIYDTAAERGYAEQLVRRVSRASQGGAAAPRPLNDRIHFLKFQPDPWRLYPEFDLVVHYSTRPEPFGRVVLEALACGIPVLAAQAGGPLEIVEAGRSGWLVPPNDPAALAGAMIRAAGADLAPLREAARRRAESRFSADRHAEEVARLLRTVASGNG